MRKAKKNPTGAQISLRDHKEGHQAVTYSAMEPGQGQHRAQRPNATHPAASSDKARGDTGHLGQLFFH